MVQAVEELPGGVSEPEEGRSVRTDQSAVLVGDCKRRERHAVVGVGGKTVRLIPNPRFTTTLRRGHAASQQEAGQDQAEEDTRLLQKSGRWVKIKQELLMKHSIKF